MRKLRYLTSALALVAGLLTPVALASPVQNNSGKEKEKEKKDKEGPVFDRPSKPTAGSHPTPEEQREPKTPEEAFERALPSITTWPGESGENALRALVARGPEVRDVLRLRLKLGTVLERSAAARGLCLLGDQESFTEIEKLFADPRQRARWSVLLESLYMLDMEGPGHGANAEALALRFLVSEQSALRVAATNLLRTHATPALLSQLRERLQTTQSSGVRLDIFVLLEQLKDKELAGIALERFLGDPDAGLAARVVMLLSWQDDAATRAELVRLAKGNQERRGLHACLALAIAEQRLNTPLLPDELFEIYLPALRTTDLLLRATACVVCGMVGLRNEAFNEVTQGQVLPALSDVVVNGRFFGDFEICFKAAVATLELLTSERLGTSVPAWREYFAHRAGKELRSRRELKAFLMDEDSQAAVVQLERAESTGAWRPLFAVAGPDHRGPVSVGERPRQLVVEAPEMRNLLTGIEQDGFLDADLPRSLTPVPAGALQLIVEIGGRRRTVAGGRDDPRLTALAARVRKIAEPGLWQLLLPPGDGYAKLFGEEWAWFSTHPDAEQRRSRLLDLALAEIDRDDGPHAQQAFDVLTYLDGLGDTVSAAQIDAIAALLKRVPPSDGRGRKLFDLLLSTRRPDAFNAIADALAPRGAAAMPWLEEAVRALPGVTVALKDPRVFVRRAALRVAARDNRPPDELLVELATQDPDSGVSEAALALLAESGSDLGTTTLLQLATNGETRVRAGALRLLGHIHSEDVLQLLTSTARAGEPALAAAALEGLARRGDEAAAAALDGIARERGSDETLGKLALVALKGLPRGLAVERLRRLSLESTGNLAREAAYGLADLGEMEAAPTLLADLENPARHRRAQTLLTYLFCQDFGTEPWRFRSLFDGRPGVGHGQYFLEALAAQGATVPVGLDLTAPEALPLLVSAIEDGRWFIRRCALELLEASTGRTLGSLPVNASTEEVKEMARRWREATTAQARSGDGEGR